jgi:RNA polymerase sigma-70 factor (ECF subfamily)
MPGSEGEPLIVGLETGDDAAFATLYDAYAPQLLRAAWGMLGAREDAEDVVQDVFIELMRSRASLGHVQNLNAYIFTAMQRSAARRAARKKEELRRVGALAPPATSAFGLLSEETESLHRALQALPSEQREVIVLKIDGGLTFEEIAEVFSISANTAASRYRYGLEKMRLLLTGMFP